MWDLWEEKAASHQTPQASCHLRWIKLSPNSQLRPLPSGFSLCLLAKRKHTHYSLFIIHSHNPMLSLLGKSVLGKWLRSEKSLLFDLPINDFRAFNREPAVTEAAPHFLFPGGKVSEKCNFPSSLLPFRKRLFSPQFSQMICYDPQHNNSPPVNL